MQDQRNLEMLSQIPRAKHGENKQELPLLFPLQVSPTAQLQRELHGRSQYVNLYIV